jgi:hypothetical protein
MALLGMQNFPVLIAVRIRLLLQLASTLTILAWLPGNGVKLAALIVVWVVGFGRISRAEWILFLGINLLFVVMNAGALRKGIFHFNHPDVLGMPVYEFFMWGFYVLNAIRFLSGAAPQGKIWQTLIVAVVFSIPFSTISDSEMLTLISAAILVGGLVLYHEPMDIAYVVYMIIMGALIEYVGVWSGQWGYPGNPPGGVPLWFISMWGGVGLFARRLLLPFLRRSGASSAIR